MFAAIADGTSQISNFSPSADCSSTLEVLTQLGVRIERKKDDLTVWGRGRYGLEASDRPLECGNSGTTMRLIAGILAGQGFMSALIGDESLSRRPMKRIIEPLAEMGAVVESVEGHAPLVIHGRYPLTPLDFKMPVASAQLKSCVLLAGLFANGDTSVLEPVPTRDHTERMLRGFGVDVRVRETDAGNLITLSGNSPLNATNIDVPADISSAAFFLVASACLPGSCLRIPNVGLNPTRDGVILELRRFGAHIDITDISESGGEPTGTLTVFGEKRLGATNCRIDGEIVANLIDEIPILAVFGSQTESGIEIRDASELRVKESDRIFAVVDNLKRMGADVTEFDDGLRVGPSKLKGAVIDPFGDHRIAMAFAVAGLFASGETNIIGAECAAVSFPDFFETLESVTVR